uniref:hypothetical protein n=1 Tax=Marinobacterium profundum TaxID=1714300 RepID=UPI00082D1266|nr:hypothetical protein [Marinobacterium profundum]
MGDHGVFHHTFYLLAALTQGHRIFAVDQFVKQHIGEHGRENRIQRGYAENAVRWRDQGLIELITSPTDGRVTLASMTPQGRERPELVRESVSGIFKRCFQALTAAQIKRLNGLLQQLHGNMLTLRD